MKSQFVHSEKLCDIYSSNPKVNNIIRTLLAFHGKKMLWTAVSDFVYTPEGLELTSDEIWQLYQSAKWTMLGD